jgi:hypothetical protein
VDLDDKQPRLVLLSDTCHLETPPSSTR